MGPIIENLLVGLVVILMVALAIRMFIVMFDGAKDSLELKPKMDYGYEDFLAARNSVVTSEPEPVPSEPVQPVEVEYYPPLQLKAEILPKKKKKTSKKKASKKKTKTRGKK